MSAYEDILHLERPVSGRPKMARGDRAKIFAPFAALTGLEEELDKMETRLLPRVCLPEEAQEVIDRRLRRLQIGDAVRIVWFCPRDRSGTLGTYEAVSGRVTGVDPIRRTLLLDVRQIPIAEITEITDAEA